MNMPKVRSEQPVLPSLLDRLIDEDPSAAREPMQGPTATLANIKASIRRDLEWVLNTRLFMPQRTDTYPELRRSLVTYGLPDFSTVLLGSEEHREMFRATVQATIERLEPRLCRLQVQINSAGEEYERALYLQISALLLIEPDPIPLLFDSRIRTLERGVRLRELRHG